MKNITFRIHHPTLNIVSDRTFRSILKKFSTLLREIQYQEVQYLITRSEIENSEKQSLRDRLEGPLNHIDAYYLGKVERGSIVIEVSLAATALWFLKNTVGESVKDAYRRSEMHKFLVDYLSGSVEREEVIDRNIDRVLDAWNFEGFLVESIEKNKTDDETLQVTVNLRTEPRLTKELESRELKIDTNLVLRELKEEISKLENRDNDA